MAPETTTESKTRGSRPKVLFFSEAVTLAHVARPVVLAASLDREQYEAVLAVHPRYMDLFEPTAVRQTDIYTIPTARFLESLAKGQPLYDLATLERYVEEDLAVMDAERPDIVIGDFRLSLSVSARLQGIPYIAISNAYWSPFARQHYPIPEHPLTRLVGVSAAQALFNLVRPMAFGLHAVPMNRLRRRYGMDTLGMDLRAVYTDSDFLLYADIPGLVPMRDLPANHRFIGPVFWSPPNRYPAWWDQVGNEKPVVYLTLGSSGRSDLLPAVAEALGNLPVSLLVATAGQPGFRSSHPNLFSADFLPGEEAAARSNLVICNGGSMTTYQALKQGVPVLGIAGNLDQHLNISALERLGAGIRIRSDQAKPARIREKVIRLMEDIGYTNCAQRLEKKLAGYSAVVRFQSFLRETCRTQQIIS